MKALFKHTVIWPHLTRAARNSKGQATVAVAYFSRGAAKLLPLRKGSVLVVDASESVVRAGQTHPNDLKILQARGVQVLTAKNLHAKVFVFGTRAFVGSMNVSASSANALVEATIETTDAKVVRAARKFILGLSAYVLGPEELERLQALYRPPKFATSAARRLRARRPEIEVPELRVAQLVSRNPPEGVSEAMDEERRAAEAKRRHRRTFRLDEFWWNRDSPFKPGMQVIQVVSEGKSRKMVTRPGTVVHTRKWRRGGKTLTFVYVEVLEGRSVRLERLKSRLGSEGIRRLKRGGKVNPVLAAELLRAWKD